MSKIRLDKFISNQTPLSRSEAVKEIKRGNVKVDGVCVKQPSFSVDTTSDITLFNSRVCYKKHIYLIMNKPKGVITASRDKSAKTVLDLVPENLRRKDLAAVGRLDKDTTGLLLITDDGDFAHNLISPKKMIPKTYVAMLDKDITKEDILAFSGGVVLKDNTRCMPALLERTAPFTAKITIYEGKYHQIKRMFGTRNIGVNELKRISVGLLKLPENLPFGQVKEVNYDDLLKNTINYNQK